ncbi:amidase signature enzyme [Marasmius fiardii PR-910]|nr:amidase signature enzyme [Marasmius fiardii PR-910]
MRYIRFVSTFWFALWPTHCCVHSLQILQSNSLGDIVEIEDHLYFIQDTENVHESGTSKNVADYVLVTSVTPPVHPLSGEVLSKILTSYASVDDVWSPSFLQGLVITSQRRTDSEILFDESLMEWLHFHQISHLFVSGSPQLHKQHSQFVVIDFPSPPPPGPYAYSKSTESLHKVYRLYADEYDSFMFGCIPQSEGKYVNWMSTNFTLPVDFLDSSNRGDPSSDSGREIYHQYIPVPSRLPQVALSFSEGHLTFSSSLLGKRMGVKDIFHMRGLPTSAGSLAFLEMNGSSNITASSVQKLIDMGVVPVGKTRTSQFAHGAHPWEFRDFSYSWNPRADGLLTAAASSSGSACSVAGYEWLDLTVGSDTRGSVRKPASLAGIYGIRPSFGSVALDGVVPLSEEMDTMGIFTRDPQLFLEVASRLYHESPVLHGQSFLRLPARLLYPVDHFPVRSVQAQLVYDYFVDALTELNVSKVPVNITHMLSPAFPDKQFSSLQNLSNMLSEYHSYTQVGKPLVEWYQTRFGQPPPLDPMPEVMFAKGSGYSESDYDRAVAYKKRFTEILGEMIFRHDSESCSDSIFVYDAGTGGLPSYRVSDFNSLEGATEITLVKPGKKATFQENLHYMASMGGLVEVTVPIGEVEYFSLVSRRWEPIPVAIELVARRGCDFVILELVKALVDKKILKRVSTGRSLFSDRAL